MTKILIYETNPGSAVSYYRTIGAFSYLHKLDPTIQIDIPKQISWDKLAGYDAIICGRPQETVNIQVIEMAKKFGLKIIIDYDDALFDLPEYNPFKDFYDQQIIKDSVMKACGMADAVIVSTRFLKDYYGAITDKSKITIIPNAFNDYIYKLQSKHHENERLVISWRGSETHSGDLELVENDIQALSEKYPEIIWCFFGCDKKDLRFILKKIKNSKHLGKCDVIDFNHYFRELSPDIHIIPLLDNSFNRAKSNCSWIEGTYAGATCIGPDIPEFTDKGCHIFSEEKNNFAYNLEKLIKNKNFREQKRQESVEYIKENLLLSHVNEQRKSVIQKVLI